MKKTVIVLSVLSLLSLNGYAYESGQLSLDTPNTLNKSEGSFTIRHRFFGKYSDTEKFLGTDDGGNMHFILKYALIDNLLIRVDHTRDKNTYGIGMEYAKDFNWIKTGIRLNSFSFKNARRDKREQSYFINTMLQTPNYQNHFRFTLNAGYDGYYEHTTLGLGVDINANNFIPQLTFTEKLSFLGEYYPQIDKIDSISGKNDAYAVGVKFQTFGHHFEVLLSNATNMDPRSMSLGTNSDDLHFGFNINRKF